MLTEREPVVAAVELDGLERRVGIGAPVVDLALRGDLGAIDELRAAILLAAGAGAGLMELWLNGQDGTA